MPPTPLPPTPQNPQGVPPAIDDRAAGRSGAGARAAADPRRRPSPLDDGRDGERASAACRACRAAPNPPPRRRSGLVWVSDDAPGIRRIRAGDGFAYVGPDGKRVRNAAELQRIRALAIPPAYEDVWICAARQRPPAGDRARCARPQAIPLPRRLAPRQGRRQVRAHARVRRRAAAHQQARRRPISPRRSARGRAATRCWRRSCGCSTRPSCASATRNTRATNRSFGLTTLRNRHAAVSGDRLQLRFRGKSGKEHEVALDDPRVAQVVRRCQAMPGQDLFQYVDEDGAAHGVGSADVNDYIRDASGADFTAKDFRTWHGTAHALALWVERSSADGERAPSAKELLGEVAQAARQHDRRLQEVVRPSARPRRAGQRARRRSAGRARARRRAAPA